ncbi:sugar kinase [Nocardia sp. CDC153]|uniref:sugar kinase n=1 Tax=Nocardia sp. CDC153 TaxID=3112167 RepID=UPI002DBBB112|nr:sugar kinase [Nocardia sp. CDC153]MEC3952969.1 sugar kinase [Nocardia sp. CDC153]
MTLGEALGVVAATDPGPLAPGAGMRLDFAGAEATVAIGVSRLGHHSTWVGSVGADSVGRMILDRLRAERVDIAHCRVDPELPTGLMLRERRTADRIRGTYYRRGLAGSCLSVDAIDATRIATAGVLHLTGITPALSESARATVDLAIGIARDADVPVSLDVNYRRALWTPAAAAAELASLAAKADILFAGVDEAALLLSDGRPANSGASNPPVIPARKHAGMTDVAHAGMTVVALEDVVALDDPVDPDDAVDPDDLALVAESLAALGPSEVVLKLGADGAAAWAGGELLREGAVPVTAVDPIGAGDAFVAGYLAGLLDGGTVSERLRLAALCGAFAVSVAGDWAGLPYRDELGLLDGVDVQR